MRNKRVASLDSFDRAILALLQLDNKMPQHRIGDAVNLSTAAVQRRIRQMEKTGVIRANVAVLDPVLLGRPLTLIVGVKLDSERNDVMTATRNALAACPLVQQCYYVTGDFDFVTVMTVRDMHEFETVSTELFRNDSNVREFRTYVVMNSIKSGLALPVDQGAEP